MKKTSLLCRLKLLECPVWTPLCGHRLYNIAYFSKLRIFRMFVCLLYLVNCYESTVFVASISTNAIAVMMQVAICQFCLTENQAI